jgi:hypothetical protein
MTDDLHRELESMAFAEATSGRARLAKLTALRSLERLRRSTAEDYPVDDDGRFHPDPPETWDLDRCDPDEVRDAWREHLSR